MRLLRQVAASGMAFGGLCFNYFVILDFAVSLGLPSAFVFPSERTSRPVAGLAS